MGVRVCFVAEVGVGVFDWGLLDLWVGVFVCVKDFIALMGF